MSSLSLSRKLALLACVVSGLFSGCSSTPTVSMDQPNCVVMPQGFTYVDQVAPAVKADIKYAGTDNFIGRPMAGYRGKRPILRIEAARALKKASDSLASRGYGLLIYDAYRPHTAMIDINKWGKDLSDQKMKAKFYPNIDKATIFKDCYIRDCSEHSRGVALDITLISLKTGRPVDMGGHHDLLDPSSATESSLVTAQQKKHRQILKQAMEGAGFVNYSLEWWHYRLSPEPDETLYFCFPAWDGMQDQTGI